MGSRDEKEAPTTDRAAFNFSKLLKPHSRSPRVESMQVMKVWGDLVCVYQIKANADSRNTPALQKELFGLRNTIQ